MPFCHPSSITVPPDRFRGADKAEVAEMADSIKKIGQLQPIIVDKDMTLTVGLHRLEACRKLDRDVWYATEEEAQLILESPLQRRIAEYQENFRRRDFTPAEMNKAIAEIDRLMREVHGSKKSGPGEDKEGWTQADTAKKLGFKSVSSVSEAIKVTKAIEAGVPGVAEAKTTQEALLLVKKTARLEASKELAKRRSAAGGDAEIENPLQFFGDKIILGDCLEKMKELPPSICDFFITDPPWGIGMDDAVEDRGSSSMKAVGCYEDGEDKLPFLAQVIKEMHRVAKPDCYVIFFCGVRHFSYLSETFKKAGFQVYSKMLVWVKIVSYESMNLKIVKSHAPAIWPNSTYDAMILARKGQPLFAQPGKPEVFLHPPVLPNDRCHQAQKPLLLMEEIIARFYHPGTNPVLIDPFAGSGSTLLAAHRLGIRLYFGYELDPENRERAIAFMVNEYMKKEEGKGTPVTIDLDDIVDLDLDEDF
jgi:DNA modification methylase